MKIAVIYARYSSDRQTEQSIEGQLRVCEDYAEKHDYKIVNTYIDRAMTGTNDKRTEFQKMLKDSSKKAWDSVIVYKIDRFGRNKYEIAMNKHTLKINGVKLLSAMENIPDTPEGIILESLLEGMAEYYSAELSQKVKRGMNETRQKGNFTGGNLPYGYKKDGKKVAIDEDKAEVVKYIFTQYANDVYVKDIIADLTNKGILNNGREFTKSTIHRLLENEKYTGIYHYKDEEFTNMYPQIISKDLFEKIRKKKDDNKYGSHSNIDPYILRMKIICGYCGRSINGITGTSKTGVVKRYYSCSGRYLKKGCKKKSVRKNALEDLIQKVLENLFSSKNAIEVFADKIINENEKRLNDQSTLNLLLDNYKGLEKSRNNMLNAIEQGIITTSTKNRLEDIEHKMGNLSKEIAVEKSKEKFHLSKSDIEKYISKAIKNTTSQMIDLLIKQIVLYDDKIEIKLNYTNISHEEDDETSFTILETKGKIPVPTESNNAVVKDKDIQIQIKI